MMNRNSTLIIRKRHFFIKMRQPFSTKMFYYQHEKAESLA